MDIEMRLKYGGLPPVRSKSLSEKTYALMLRALFLQSHQKTMKELEYIARDLDYTALKSTSSFLNSTPEEILYFYFSNMGLKREYELMTESEADKIIALLSKH